MNGGVLTARQVHGQREEAGRLAEGPADRLPRQPALVRAVPPQFPPPVARGERVERRLRAGFPPPRRDRRFPDPARTGLGLNEIRVIGVIAHPVAHEPEPAEYPLGPLPIRGGKARESRLVRLRVIPDHRGVHDRDPPHRLADDGERLRGIQRADLAQPVGGVAHAEHRPLQGARLGQRIPVPGHPAPGRAEPGVFSRGLERLPAACAGPGVHHVMLRAMTGNSPDPEL